MVNSVYTIPAYLSEENLCSPILKYQWDDLTVAKVFKHDSDILFEKLDNVSLRGKIALGIGIYEWIVWGFHHVSDDPVPYQIAEAAWCSNILNIYSGDIELNKKNYSGPIRRPLWLANTWLMPLIYYSDDSQAEWQSGIYVLYQLAMHITPKVESLEEWLSLIIDRLVKTHPAPEDNLFNDLFNEHREERRGPLVAREVLDPSFDYRPEQAPAMCDQFLRSVDYTKNSFLRSPKELIELGVEYPYQVLIDE